MNLKAFLLHAICISFAVQISSLSVDLETEIIPQNPINGPYNSTESSNYIELVLVADTKVFKSFDSDAQKFHNYSKNLINHVNSLFAPLDIFIALTDVVIWTQEDQMEITANVDRTLGNFLQYRRQSLTIDHPNDYAVLLTGQYFDGGIVESTLKKPICTYEYSGSVVTFQTKSITSSATVIAHAIGHVLGMEHDEGNKCACPDKHCIMSPFYSENGQSHWSSCSVDQLSLAFKRGMNLCLKNLPKQLFGSPTCGNGFVEEDEECGKKAD